jgi:hypothetical protein
MEMLMNTLVRKLMTGFALMGVLMSASSSALVDGADRMSLDEAFKNTYEKTLNAEWTLLLQKLEPLDPKALTESLRGTMLSRYGPMAIVGPVTVGGLGDSRSVDMENLEYEGGWYLIPVTWAAVNDRAVPIIVRGRQLDGDGEVWFGEGTDLTGQLLLAVGDTFSPMRTPCAEWVGICFAGEGSG